jgi:hypothetical protein
VSAAPSQTPEAAGLEDAGHIVWWKAGGVSYYPKGEDFTVSASCRVEPLVTAASAQAIIDRLKLAICGGEDVPGAINLVTIEDCERFCREAQAQHSALIDRATAAEARADRLEAALIEALPYVESYEYDNGYKPGAVLRVVKNIRAALQQEG